MNAPDTLFVSEGDPAGIGPEIIIRALQRHEMDSGQCVVVCGYPEHFASISAELATAFLPWTEALSRIKGGRILWADAGGEAAWGAAVAPGQESDAGSRAAIRSLEAATEAVLQAPANRGLCTAPINKANLARAGYAWPGHTEFLAARGGVEDFAMMLAIPGLRVVLATIHVPLREVPGLLSTEKLVRLISLVDRSMRDFAIDSPRIAVAGLNPHAGEEGRFGREEIEVIGPAVEKARAAGIQAEGPFPADTLFHRAYAGEFDVVIAMYHDQALIPIKTLDFFGGVNVTLGLPFVRTSPDHGTAYGLAGQDKADPRSMIGALAMGFELVRRRARGTQNS